MELSQCTNDQKYFSMISEIGGYSGLLIGFSMMDLAAIIKVAVNLLFQKRNKTILI